MVTRAMARKKRFIPGIYNYCDRWCERCAYTGRCRAYRDSEQLSRRHRRKGENPEAMNKVLAEVGRSFEKVRRLLERYARSKGLDLDELARLGQVEQAREADDERRLDRHPLFLDAERYMKACGELLKELRPMFDAARDEAAERASYMDVTAEAGDLGRLREALAVLAWDHTLICVKVRRALHGRWRAEREADAELCSAELDDAAGSGHVARHSLIRSKAALTEVYEWDEDRRDAVIELLATAERVQRGLEAAVPGAIGFVWPPAQPDGS